MINRAGLVRGERGKAERLDQEFLQAVPGFWGFALNSDPAGFLCQYAVVCLILSQAKAFVTWSPL